MTGTHSGDDRDQDAAKDHARRPDVRRAGSDAGRKRSVLAETTASRTTSIANAAVLKDLDVFAVMTNGGQVPLDGDHGLGLYHRDFRYLRGYEMRLAGRRPQLLGVAAHEGARGRFHLVNMRSRSLDGVVSEAHDLSILIERQVDGARREMSDVLRIRNYGHDDVEVPITLQFVARFENLFAVRGQVEDPEAEHCMPTLEDDCLMFAATGIDDRERRLSIDLPRGARLLSDDVEQGVEIELRLLLAAGEETSCGVRLRIDDHLEHPTIDEHHEARGSAGGSRKVLALDTDSTFLAEIVRQSLVDVEMLADDWEGNAFLNAGVPWFATLYGRDAAITSLQLIDFWPELAAGSARLLARHQGQRCEAWRDEEPGKILHELRRDDMTACDLLPYSPYYGTADATPLFLMVVGAHRRATGDASLFRELRPQVEAALQWTLRRTQDRGLLDYVSELRGDRRIQKGWRDSTDGIVLPDGTVPDDPIALVEVQSYVWRAWRDTAEILDAEDGPGSGDDLRRRADELRELVHDRFRSERLDGMFSLALCCDGDVPADVASSNPGHALWCGIVDEEVAHATAHRLLRDDMFSGWGIRTLGSEERAYNPVSYHRGSVWPHDNAICAAGLRRYGFDDEAMRVVDGMLDASRHFESHRLPELFAGHHRSSFPVPVRYPVACHPQAWASASVPMLLGTCLGLQVDAPARQLRFRRSMLPLQASRLTLAGIRVGDADVTARFERVGRESPAARLVDVEGADGIDVVVDEG